MSDRLLSLLFLGLLGLLVSTGCAHRNQKTTLAPSIPVTTPADSPNQVTSSNDERPSDLEEIDTSFDEFEAEYQDELIHVADPLAPWNKLMFHFNDKLYFWFFKPITVGYRAIFPEFARKGVRNFFRNLFTPIRFTNSVLQGKGSAAGRELASFLVNSTWGVLGFGEPAQKKLKLALSDEDLGQTFGAYRIGNGFYIVWPILGPSTLRDSVGKLGDSFLNPLFYIESTEAGIAIWFYDRVNDTSFRIGEYEAIKEAAIEPYEAFRDGYIQFRKTQVEQ
jgi:phospholipid-binding lipoprotein MlaA